MRSGKRLTVCWLIKLVQRLAMEKRNFTTAWSIVVYWGFCCILANGPGKLAKQLRRFGRMLALLLRRLLTAWSPFSAIENEFTSCRKSPRISKGLTVHKQNT